MSAPREDAPLVQARDLAKAFDVSAPWLNRVLERKPRQLLHAVDGVSFDIARGQTLALVGESGCGKSTVARLLVGLYEPSRGSFAFDGADAHAGFRSRAEPRLAAPHPDDLPGPVRQPESALDGGATSSASRCTSTASCRRPARCATPWRELLQGVGLSAQDMAKYPHQFSGGQRQRISIARALATAARVPGVRRADQRAGRERPGPGAQHHEGPAAQAGPDLPVHLAQPGGGAPRERPGRRDVPGAAGGTGRQARAVRRRRATPTRACCSTRSRRCTTRGGRGRRCKARCPTRWTRPPGCAFNPRCPHANERCRVERPELLAIGGIRVACHAVEEGRI